MLRAAAWMANITNINISVSTSQGIVLVDTNSDYCPLSNLVCLYNPQSPLGGSSDNLEKSKEVSV